jgi:hypothetical protein
MAENFIEDRTTTRYSLTLLLIRELRSPQQGWWRFIYYETRHGVYFLYKLLL